MTQTPTQDSKDWLDEVLERHIDPTCSAVPDVVERHKAEAKAAIESHYAKELEKAVREARIDEVEGFVKLYREHWEEWEFRAAIGRRIDQLNKESD